MRPGFFKTLIAAAAGAGGVAPSTIDVPFASVAPAIWGPVDTTTNAARTFILSNGKAGMAMLVTGTDATLDVRRSSGSSTNGMILVSIDGAAEVALNPTGTVYTLFTGLAQATRLVQVRVADSWGGVIYIDESLSALMTVTGAPPSISAPAAWVGALDGNALAVSSGFKVTSSAGFVPANLPTGLLATPQGSAIPSVRLRSATTSLIIVGRSRRVFVSIDGGTTTRYDTTIADGALRTLRVTGLGTSAKNLNVWAGTTSGSGNANPLFVGVDSALIDLTFKGRVDQYGDSISQGQGATCPGNVETMAVAAALGYVGSTYGSNGDTVAILKARIDACLAGKDNDNTKDVAVLAIGRNGAGTGLAGDFTAGIQADMDYILSALLVKYAKVLVRGVMPESGTTFAGYNGAVTAWVATKDTSRVKYIDVSDMDPATVSRADGVHPNDAGYVTMAGLFFTRYTAALA